MPVIGLGTLHTNNLKSAMVALDAALNCGYRHIDNAFSYMNEVQLGMVLRYILASGKYKREDLFITSMLPCNGMRPCNVEYFVRQSLLGLQVDYIDMYLIQNPIATVRTPHDWEFYPIKDDGQILVDNVDLMETWNVLENLVLLGGLTSLGLSNCNSKQIQYIYDNSTILPANVQVECHPYLPQNELFEFCKNLGIAFTAYSPLGAPKPFQYLREGSGFFREHEPPRLLADDRLKIIAKRHGKSVAQVLLRFQTQRGIIPIPGSECPKQIKENIDVFDFDLDELDLKVLKSMESGYRYSRFEFSESMRSHPEHPFRNVDF